MEEAINQLQDLGVTRGQAKRALARYNNDVALAADYIFSGADLSDDETEQKPKAEPIDTDNLFKETIESSVHLDKNDLLHNTTYDVSKWGIVPVTAEAKPAQHDFSSSSLTWWKDPEDPTERIASTSIPIGLRPPSYHFAYSPTIVQALFHITAFQQAVLSFRPIPYAWGSPENYWKGFGEPVPNYRMHPKASHPPKEKTELDPSKAELISFEGEKEEVQLIALDSPELTLDELNLEDKPIPSQQQQQQQGEREENELEIMTSSMQAFAELQRLFAFLGNTQRQYGSVSHFVRALNSKDQQTPGQWGNNEKSFETFLDMLILCLVEVDEQSEKAVDMDFKPIFRNLFVLKAHIEEGDDYEEEEVYYLSIGTGHGMHSFHECLDPLVFDKYPSDHYKFTSFKQIPPLLWVVLENQTSEYQVDKTIYLDRYRQSNKQRAIQEFIKMDGYTKEMVQIDQEIQRLKKSQGLDRLDILSQACAYFEQSHEGLRTLLTSVQHDLQQQLDQLESRKEGLRQAKTCLFEDMKDYPYDLRATFHHDGKSGTGHYWAYVYVESSEVSLLEDMEPTRKAGWFKFCDASVAPVSEDALWNDPVRPFSMLYADRSICQFTRDQLNACIPDTLNDFIQADHALLRQEIEAYKHPKQPEEDESMSIASSSSLQQFDLMTSAPEKEESETEEKYMYTGEGFDQLKNKVNESMTLANSLASDDGVFLKKFEAFLARTQNRAALEHLYLLYSSEDGINEELSRQDSDLELIWNEYDDYREIGQQMVKALDYFVKQDHQHALESLLETKRQEAMWKTELMLNQEVAQAYPGLETLSFGGLIKRCGQYSLKVLNELAYAKAINPAYRMRGLEDGLRIAQQAQSIIADSTSTEGDAVHQQLQNRWLSFTDEIEGELSEQEANLLNTMIMIWFEGQSTEERVVDSKLLTLDMPLWQKYQQLRDTSESMLTL